MKFSKLITSLVGGAVFFSANLANSITMEITPIIGSDGGYGYSLLHTASTSNRMGGRIEDYIVGGTGTFDTETGQLSASFDLGARNGAANGATMTLEGYLDFDSVSSDHWLDTTSQLTATFSGGGYDNTVFTFTPGDQCCTGDHDPNSFSDNLITLWGSNGFNALTGGWSGVDLGIDLRMELNPVPIPGALLFFGTGLFAFGAIRRKAKKVSA